MNKRQNISLLSTLSAAVILTSLSGPAQAQPAEEPYYEQVVEIHVGPPAARVSPARQKADRKRPCTSCAVAVVHKPAHRPKPVNSGPFISLDANIGYGGFHFAFGESVSGPFYSGAFSVLWGAGHSKGGFRLTGFYSTAEGKIDHFLGSSNDQATSQLAGGSIMAQGEYKGLWGATGLGVVHLTTDYIESAGYDSGDSFVKNEHTTLPELCLAAGYNLHLSKNFALRVSGDVGTFFFLSWRASISGGVMVSF